jgi:signal transduction histidine kinase
MNPPVHTKPSRILVVDDNSAIHADFAKILTGSASTSTLDDIERLAFADAPARALDVHAVYDLDFAFQGEEGLERVAAAMRAGDPYALAFVDMRMPPGWNGLETVERFWAVDPALQVVICSAYSDYDWEEVLARLNRPDKLLIIQKPFDAIEVLQSANMLTGKWRSETALREHLESLESTIRIRTASLADSNQSLIEQMRLRQAAELELGLAQKLESVGRLAAGIAHEINTPVQYISDSVHFLKIGFDDLLALVTALQEGTAPQPHIDLQFLRTEVPLSIERIVGGTERVATIVRAMKDFSHPDASEKLLSDLNRALETTLLIAHNEYKYVATVALELGPIPEITCNVGELNQVFLNLIVNAAHALADAGRDSETGRIIIRTRVVGTQVEVTVEDNGCGIPAEIVGKIYDPFFTTKEMGRGTGQGLALARAIVVDKHSGHISVVSAPGEGTCFTVRLPLDKVDGAP